MRTHIDISVFVQDQTSVGRIHGEMQLAACPSVGDKVSFLSPKNPGVLLDQSYCVNLQLKVEDVVFSASELSIASISLMIEDLIAPDQTAAEKLIKYFETGFNFFFDPTDT